MTHKASSGYLHTYQLGHPRTCYSGSVPVHVLVAEKALGKFLDSKHPVHHINGDRTDNRNQNLVICESPGYHYLLHYRQRILKLGGDPDIQGWCGHCKQLRPLAFFYKLANGKKVGPCMDCSHIKIMKYERKSRPVSSAGYQHNRARRVISRRIERINDVDCLVEQLACGHIYQAVIHQGRQVNALRRNCRNCPKKGVVIPKPILTQCRHGHPYPENLSIRSDGSPRCAECHRIGSRKSSQRKDEQ